jgi:Ni2+-binding GTPase involved in maturation of urease and hydrogenase
MGLIYYSSGCHIDPSTTLQVVSELIKHDKEFEFVIIPEAGYTDGWK